MAGASFKMDMDVLMRGVDAALSRAQRTQELADSIGDFLVSSTQERFETGEDPEGDAWIPSRRAESTGGKTLVDSGHLKSSISYEASPSMVVVGTNTVYARIHQNGGKAGRNHAVTMPARPYLGFNDEDLAEVRGMCGDFLRSLFTGGRL